jgi:CDP-diacylglycerol--serine O-phosphatidyltransferase
VSKPLLFIRLVPNLLTFAALAIGFSSIRFALDGAWEKAVWCVILAGILDMLDGRIARFFKVTSSLGVELDSLADLVNFGAVPAILLYLWSAPSTSNKFLLWGAVSFYLICAAIRLAKFNLVAHKLSVEHGMRYFFFGMPSTTGGMFALMPIVYDFELSQHFDYHVRGSPFLAFYLVVVGVLMASRVPTFSIKSIRVPQEYIWILLISFGILIVSLFLYPWYMMPICAVLYLISIIFSVAFFDRLKTR